MHTLLRCQNFFPFLPVLYEQVFPDWKSVYGLLGFASGPSLDVFSGIFRYTNLWYFNAGYVLLDPDFQPRHWKRVPVRPKGGKWLHNQVGFWCDFPSFLYFELDILNPQLLTFKNSKPAQILEAQLKGDDTMADTAKIAFDTEVRVGDFVYAGDSIFQYQPDITYDVKIECFERWELKAAIAVQAEHEGAELSRKSLMRNVLSYEKHEDAMSILKSCGL